MADDDRDRLPFYSPQWKPCGIPRTRTPGIELWRVRNHAGTVQTCELRDDTCAGAGWDVMLLEDGEPLFSRRCVDERGARYVAESFRQDLLRTGWTDSER